MTMQRTEELKQKGRPSTATGEGRRLAEQAGGTPPAFTMPNDPSLGTGELAAGFTNAIDPLDAVNRALLRGGMSPYLMFMPFFDKLSKQLASYVFLSQLLGGGQQSEILGQEGIGQRAFGGGNLSEMLGGLLAGVGKPGGSAFTPFTAAEQGRQTVEDETVGVQGAAAGLPAGVGTPGVPGGDVNMLRALLMADPRLLNLIVGTTTFGNAGQSALLGNFTQNYLAPLYRSFGFEFGQAGEDPLSLLDRLVGLRR